MHQYRIYLLLPIFEYPNGLGVLLILAGLVSLKNKAAHVRKGVFQSEKESEFSPVSKVQYLPLGNLKKPLIH